MNNNKKFCYNCGNYGHITKYCHFPIISTGIIGFKKINNEFFFLLIKRKDTIGLTNIVRGDYDNNLSSILSLPITTFPSYSSARSVNMGAIILHGPHHSAQKSTNTGSDALITSESKLSSVS